MIEDLTRRLTPQARRDLYEHCAEKGVDPDDVALVDRTEFLVAKEFQAEAAEAFSKYLREECGWPPAVVETMNLRDLSAAVKAEVGEE